MSVFLWENDLEEEEEEVEEEEEEEDFERKSSPTPSSSNINIFPASSSFISSWYFINSSVVTISNGNID
jgi:hypothetical protein